MTQDEPTLKETLDFFRELNQLMDLLKVVRPKLHELLSIMDKQADGTDPIAWFTAVDKIVALEEDDMIACLALAIGTISKARVAVRDTAMERELMGILGLGEPQAQAQES